MLKDNYIFVGDLHITLSNLKTSEAFFVFLDKQIEKYSPKGIFFLGDIYDTKAVIRSEVQNFFWKWCQKQNLSIVLITGNHDFVDNECNESALLVLSTPSNVTVVEKALSIEDVGFLAYQRNPQKFKEILNQNPQWKFVFCHQDFTGFKYGSGKEIIDGIDLDSLDSKTIFISGHIHTKAKNKNVFYVGSPYSINFGEANEQKVIGLISGGKIKLIDVVGIPQHYCFDLKINEDAIMIADNLLKEKEIRKDDLIRFNCETSKNSLVHFEDVHKSSVKNWLKSQFSFLEDFQIHFKISDEANVIKINEKWSYPKMIEEYISSSKTKLDKTELLKMSTGLLGEV